jgi:hypothetical protein
MLIVSPQLLKKRDSGYFLARLAGYRKCDFAVADKILKQFVESQSIPTKQFVGA